jgi:hypothetical protein
MTIGGSLLLIALGAILKWAVTAHVNGINLHTVGTICFVVGIIGLVLSLIWSFWWADRDRRLRDDTRVMRPPPTRGI